MNNPSVRYAVRAFLVGVTALAASLQADLPGISGDDIVQAVLALIVAALAYAGIGAVSPVEPHVGLNKKP